MADTAASSSEPEQVTQLKGYLKTIMAKQEELKKTLAVKHEKAVRARRASQALGSASLRNVMVESDDDKHTARCVETPGMEKRLESYADNVDELEKELEETTKLVNEVATALAVLGAQPQAT
jgi:DNA-directed RNA polymerase specialized sigma subunit